jgi:probable rRNA maturation factor
MMTTDQGIEVQYASGLQSLPDEALLQRWARSALPPDTQPPGLVIRVVDEDESRELNSRYRGKDKATNVLSFPFEAPEEVDIGHLGDLVICAAIVNREAAEQGKPVEHHWAHMIVHGVLHLRGYDHLTDTQAGEMEGLEIRILQELDIPDPYNTQDMAV